ncbi:MAG: DNA translocase FtsK 4TM domain-containing protein [Chthoniobacterales bacterium]|nr:DNA translocase FtsK 4TM domain-containing protein [Chthoniobacterales bacterium]
MAKGAQHNAWNEVYALILLGTGTLLFLSLISYVPKDIPTWFPLLNSTSSPNRPAQNFLGPLGAVGAGICYFLIGAASYLLAATLLGFGGAKLFHAELKVSRRIGWIVLFIASGACLFQLQPWFLHDWHRIFNIDGPGGRLGAFFGRRVFRVLLGKGSVIVLFGIYLTSLILMTGLRPIHIVRQSVFAIRRGWVALRLWFLRRRMRKADLKGQLEISQQQIAKQQRAIEKRLRKKGAAVSEPTPFTTPEEFANRPEPKVVDTTALPEELTPPRKKPSLAELKKGGGKSKPSPALGAPKDWEGENYELPGIDLLEEHDSEGRVAADPAELEEIQQTLIETLGQFGIQVAPGDITKGPTITRYEVYPAKGVRVDKIVSLERDLARATRAERINILAPIPGKDTVGIELANSRKVKVTLRELLQSPDWNASTAKLPIALGKDVYGKTIIADLAQMPHLLVAGTTGSGKSVCINALIASMLYRFTPDQLRFIMIDPKVVEMQVYNSLPHLVIPVVTDPKKVLLALRWVIDEMEKRYKIFAKAGVRNITSFNGRPKKKTQAEMDADVEAGVAPAQNGKAADTTASLPISVPREDELIVPDHMPYIVVIIDELADLMQTAPADVESAIARITQMARAAGIHLIVATQTPRADVITGVIKANIPSRIAFQVASKIDSRVILDENGADRLLGQGDMLYLPPSTSRLIRAQGVLVTDDEIGRLVDFVSAQSSPAFDLAMHERMESTAAPNDDVTDEDEELVEKCLEIIRQEKRASTSLLQRRLRLGYTRAARIVDILEQRGILGPGEGAKPREILVDLDATV